MDWHDHAVFNGVLAGTSTFLLIALIFAAVSLAICLVSTVQWQHRKEREEAERLAKIRVEETKSYSRKRNGVSYEYRIEQDDREGC